jgi:hypothetical protein
MTTATGYLSMIRAWLWICLIGAVGLWLADEAAAQSPDANALVKKLTAGDEAARGEALDKVDQAVADLTILSAALATMVAEDGQEASRLRALRLLRKIGPPARPALPTLIEAARDPDLPEALHYDVLAALADIDPTGAESLPPLLAALRETRTFAAMNGAIEGCSRLGPAALPAVEPLWKQVETPSTRYRAMRALLRLSPAAAIAVANLSKEVPESQLALYGEALRAFGSDAKPVVDGLVADLAREQLPVRMRAIRLLATLGPTAYSAHKTLARLAIEDPDPAVRILAEKMAPQLAMSAEDYERLTKLRARHFGKIRFDLKGYEAREHGKALNQLMAEWNPVGSRIEALYYVLGPPTAVDKEWVTYSIDLASIALIWQFRNQAGKIVERANPPGD